MKKLTVEDFPFMVNDAVHQAFVKYLAAEKTVRAMIEAILASQMENAVDPWEIVRREHPELMEFEAEYGDKYYMSKSVLTKNMNLQIRKPK